MCHDDGMRIDHVSYAAGPDGLQATAARLGEQLGVTPFDGGVHPRFGTRNVILPLADDRYLEVVEALDHPASDKAPFGQAVKARSARGGGWMAWVVAVEDLAPVEERLGRGAVEGNRHTPEGNQLQWLQIGVKNVINHGNLPFFIKWISDPAEHPSRLADSAARLVGLTIGGEPTVVRAWLGMPDLERRDPTFETAVEFGFVEDDEPCLFDVTFETPNGRVTI
ncbi:glyoxalase-like protein [Ornithinimicrobium humiphilum]|uniref:Glyoxalase-like protein n=2 Tax=Ornithinimicrobium humiphilum TaxID=125288 RepID=A0A543KJZ4_9MICO|nr:glyoxalase-like protein [Ornithinimicrobium humiphilum]